MSEDFWVSLQLLWDLYRTKQAEGKELKTIKPLKLPQTAV
jgi:plasmid maintenance system antidote protein VapI